MLTPSFIMLYVSLLFALLGYMSYQYDKKIKTLEQKIKHIDEFLVKKYPENKQSIEDIESENFLKNKGQGN